MDSSNLAERLIQKLSSAPHIASSTVTKFSVEMAPEIILSRHPAIYRIGSRLYHEHEFVRSGDTELLYRLIDMPDAKLNKAQAIWVYNRLFESAPELSRDCVLVSRDYLWDRRTAQLIHVSDRDFVTSKDKTTLRIRREDEQRTDTERVG